ncbi:MAG: phytanoyl-CoA dioxygenase family protein [Planctomycetota bacterium]
MTASPLATAPDPAGPARREHPSRLTAEQARQFHEQGFLGPLTACSAEEMAAYRSHIEELILEGGIGGGGSVHNRHLDDRLVYELSTRPEIVQPMTSILGDDLLLWRTNFFNKQPGGKEIPWHQDRNYWPIEPEVVISAWLAIDPSTIENSCVQVIPGTHRKLVPHAAIKAEERAIKQFAEEAVLDGIDTSGMINMELEAGQFMLFNERTLHHSEPNRSDKRRMGMAIRVILPQVRVLSTDSPRHKMMVVAGQDRMGFNPRCDPPAG